jgi:hypothetical protein
MDIASLSSAQAAGSLAMNYQVKMLSLANDQEKLIGSLITALLPSPQGVGQNIDIQA